MISVEESIDIRAPIEIVFAAVTDPRRAPEWNPHVIQVSDPAPLPVREGTTWRQQASMAGRSLTLNCRVTVFRPPFEGVLEATGEQHGWISTRCSAENGYTRVVQRLEFESPGGLAGKLAAQVAGPMIRREMVQSLARVRATLEGGDAGGPRSA